MSTVKVIFDTIIGILLYMSYTPPEDAATNFVKWLKFFNVENFPQFLNNPSVNNAIFIVSLLSFIIISISLIKDLIRYLSKRKLNRANVITKLNELHEEGKSNTWRYCGVGMGEKDLDLKNKKWDCRWRKKVKRYLPVQHHFYFDNLPKEKDKGALYQFFIDFHRHSLSVIEMAIRDLGKQMAVNSN